MHASAAPRSSSRWLIAVLFALLGAQGAFWWKLHDERPPMEIIEAPPGRAAVSALSLGDEEVFFRLLGEEVQTAGDLFGRFTALFKYDYVRLVEWFDLLDSLNSRSDLIPTLASYYYSQTQYVPDARGVVMYLARHAERDLAHKWWWQVQAIYLANHKLHDRDLALQFAKKLEGRRDLPVWVQQMPAFIYEQRGEMDSAMHIMEDIKNNAQDIPQSELNFMQYFVKERLGALEKKQREAVGGPERKSL